MICVTITRMNGETTAYRFALAEGVQCRIGRDATCEISLPEENYLSRVHCLIFYSNGQLIIQDNQSSNGVFLGDQRIVSDFLVMNEAYRMGDCYMTVQEDEDAPDQQESTYEPGPGYASGYGQPVAYPSPTQAYPAQQTYASVEAYPSQPQPYSQPVATPPMQAYPQAGGYSQPSAYPAAQGYPQAYPPTAAYPQMGAYPAQQVYPQSPVYPQGYPQPQPYSQPAAYPAPGQQFYPQTVAYPAPGQQTYPQAETYPAPGQLAYPQAEAYPAPEQPSYPQAETYPTPGQQAYPRAEAYPTPEQPAYPQAETYPAPGQQSYPQAEAYPTPEQPAYPQAEAYPAPEQPAYPQAETYPAPEQPAYPQAEACPAAETYSTPAVGSREEVAAAMPSGGIEEILTNDLLGKEKNSLREKFSDVLAAGRKIDLLGNVANILSSGKRKLQHWRSGRRKKKASDGSGKNDQSVEEEETCDRAGDEELIRESPRVQPEPQAELEAPQTKSSADTSSESGTAARRVIVQRKRGKNAHKPELQMQGLPGNLIDLPTDFELLFRVTTPARRFEEGAPLRFFVKADRDCRIFLIAHDSEGGTELILPGNEQTDNLVFSAVEAKFPGMGHEDYHMVVEPPFGTETIVLLAVATTGKCDFAKELRERVKLHTADQRPGDLERQALLAFREKHGKHSNIGDLAWTSATLSITTLPQSTSGVSAVES